MFTLRAHGRPAHAGLEPEKGANAIVEIARQIAVIHAIADVSVGTTVNVTTIRGGTTTNVIPEHAECQIDVRFSTMNDATRVDAALRSLVSFDDRVNLELVGGINRPPLERTERVIALYEQARRVAGKLGFELGETSVGGASDANFAAAVGAAACGSVGPGHAARSFLGRSG